MIDNEIKKALECCCTLEGVGCRNCPQYDIHSAMCVKNLIRNALDLINRQKAEILELQKRIINWRADMDYRPDEIKSEAIKEFAERVKLYIDVGHLRPPTEQCFSELDVVNMIDNLVKERTEVETNQRKEDEGK